MNAQHPKTYTALYPKHIQHCQMLMGCTHLMVENVSHQSVRGIRGTNLVKVASLESSIAE